MAAEKTRKWADWLLFLLPLSFPLYLLKFEFFGVPTNFIELMVGVCLVLQVVFHGKSFKRVPVAVWWLSGAFLLIGVVQTLIVPRETLLIDKVTVYESFKVALGIFKGWLVVPLVYFIMLVARVRDEKALFVSLYAYIVSALPLVIWAFGQYLTGHFITADGRASGPFVNANYLAMYLVPAVTALWILIVRGILNGFRPKRFFAGVALAILYSITMLMTQSYGAMLAVMAALLFYLVFVLFLHKREGQLRKLAVLKKISYFLGILALIAVLSASVLYAGTAKWQKFLDFGGRSSNSVRLQVYQIAGTMIGQSPILGLGLGQFEPQYNLRAPEILGHAPHEWVMIHPHDTLLSFWVNLGLAGVIFYLLVVVLVGRELWRERSYEMRMFKLIGVCMFLAMVLHGLVDTYFFKNDLAMVFWLVVGLVFLPVESGKDGLKSKSTHP